MSSSSISGGQASLEVIGSVEIYKAGWIMFVKLFSISLIILDKVSAQWRWSRGDADYDGLATALAVIDERIIGQIYYVGEPTAFAEEDWLLDRLVLWLSWPNSFLDGALSGVCD